jgi:WD40 repeat protein
VGAEPKAGTPRWLLVLTGVVGLVAATFLVVARYYDIRKAKAEALRAEAEAAARVAPTPTAGTPPGPGPEPPRKGQPALNSPPPQPAELPALVEPVGEVRRFTRHQGQVWAVAVSPDGSTAVSGGQDKTARVWNLRTGAEIRVLEGHTGLVRHVAFSPDGTRVATASWDNTPGCGRWRRVGRWLSSAVTPVTSPGLRLTWAVPTS